MKKLLFSHLGLSSFVRDDLAILGAHYDVRPFHFDVARARSAFGLARVVAAQRRWLRRELPGAHAVFGWFADHHMALPVALSRRAGVPSAVVLSGTDVNTVPDVGYGALLTWRAPLVRFVLRRASLLLPVTPSLVYSENHFAQPPHVLRNGARAHVPGLTTPLTVVPPGLDAGAWAMGPAQRPPAVLTVAFVRRPRDARLKGLDLFAAAAARLPGVPFRAVGVAPEMRAQLPNLPNLTWLPPLPRAALQAEYARASVYAHFSRSEGGLPLVVAEAMLCGCCPVGSPVGGMPDVIGDVGFIAPTPDPDLLAHLVEQALARADGVRAAARARVATRYPLAQRETMLVAALESLGRP